MTVVVEGKNSFFIADRAMILDPTHEMAWAEKYVTDNPAVSWVLGKFVEAERENANRQWWSLNDLEMSQPSISNAPMNMLHRPREIVGTFVANEMMYPKQGNPVAYAAEDELGQNPYIEALGVFWRYYFPREYSYIKEAHEQASLFFSMECVAETITCAGEGCGNEYAYDGPTSDTYCEHLNDKASRRQLNNPLFLGGALIIPPASPAWSDAQITEFSSLVKQHATEVEHAYEGIVESAPDLGADQAEWLLAQIVIDAFFEEGRDVSPEERKKLAKEGKARPDGGFPVANLNDLSNAVQAWGRSKPEQRPALKRLLLRRARALAAPDDLIERIQSLTT